MRRIQFPFAVFATAGFLIAGCASKAPSTNAEPPAAKPPAAQTGMRDPGPLSGEWRWVRTVTPVESIVADDPTHYTLTFNEGGKLAVRADCNSGSGTFTQDGKSLAIGPFALTRMACPPGSLDSKFVTQVGGVATCFMSGDTLMIDLKMDSGTMRFVRGS